MFPASKKVSQWVKASAAAVAADALASSSASALSPLPFTEDFSVNDSLWGTGQTPSGSRFAPTYNATGGPDGAGDGYISYTKPFTTSSASTIFRCQDIFNSSNDAFVGNWEAAQMQELSFYIKHDNPNPTTIFVRLATAANFPAFAIPAPVDVPTDTWTKITLPVTFADYTAAGSQWTFETFDDPEPPPAENYTTVFGNLANIQILAESEDATSVSFSLDKISIVPEPASLGLLAVAAAPVLMRRRRQGGRA